MDIRVGEEGKGKIKLLIVKILIVTKNISFSTAKLICIKLYGEILYYWKLKLDWHYVEHV